MLAVVLGYVFALLAICLHLYHWYRWKTLQNKRKIIAICKVIIFRTIGIVFCTIALVMTEHRSIFLLAICSFSLPFLICDVWRLKWQIDEMIK